MSCYVSLSDESLFTRFPCEDHHCVLTMIVDLPYVVPVFSFTCILLSLHIIYVTCTMYMYVYNFVYIYLGE